VGFELGFSVQNGKSGTRKRVKHSVSPRSVSRRASKPVRDKHQDLGECSSIHLRFKNQSSTRSSIRPVQRHAKNFEISTDCKINDVGYTNRAIAEYYFKAGFDAVIANPFVGWDEGLQPVFEVAESKRRGVILLVYMSHKGAPEGYGQTIRDPKTERHILQYVAFARKALEWKADGAVVGATYPEKIREVHSILKNSVPIFSPGIGAQGGDVETAVKAGARYLIVGRAITLAEDPAETTRIIRDIARNV